MGDRPIFVEGAKGLCGGVGGNSGWLPGDIGMVGSKKACGGICCMRRANGL